MFNNKYPYTDMHELNLDWLIQRVTDLVKEMSDFKISHEAKWLGEWTPSTSYLAWSIVSYEHSVYISLKAVPANISIDNREYWQYVVEYRQLFEELDGRISDNSHRIDSNLSSIQNLQNQTNKIESIIGETWLSSKSYVVNNVVKYEGKLYSCLVNNTGVLPTNTTYWRVFTINSEFDSINNKNNKLTYGSIEVLGDYISIRINNSSEIQISEKLGVRFLKDGRLVWSLQQ